jgi:uncharacterized integral membrane protein
MLIIWRGLGILIPAIVFGFVVLTNLACNAQFGADYWKQHTWPAGVALLASAVTCILCGRYFETRRKRIAREHKPGGFIPLRNDLFYINYLWWGLIIFIVSMLVLLNVVPSPSAAFAR